MLVSTYTALINRLRVVQGEAKRPLYVEKKGDAEGPPLSSSLIRVTREPKAVLESVNQQQGPLCHVRRERAEDQTEGPAPTE